MGILRKKSYLLCQNISYMSTLDTRFIFPFRQSFSLNSQNKAFNYFLNKFLLSRNSRGFLGINVLQLETHASSTGFSEQRRQSTLPMHLPTATNRLCHQRPPEVAVSILHCLRIIPTGTEVGMVGVGDASHQIHKQCVTSIYTWFLPCSSL